MQTYLVGGAVRDALLGLPVRERDWVVVGALPEELVRLGYRQVGRDFPVFLHPDTQEEHALARLERKTRPGYRGFEVTFSPEVTLETFSSRFHGNDERIDVASLGLSTELWTGVAAELLS